MRLKIRCKVHGYTIKGEVIFLSLPDGEFETDMTEVYCDRYEEHGEERFDDYATNELTATLV